VGKYYAYLFGKVFNRQVCIFIGANSIVNYMLFALNIRIKAFNAFPTKQNRIHCHASTQRTVVQSSCAADNWALALLRKIRTTNATALFVRYYLATSCMKSTRKQDAKMHTSKKHPNVLMSSVLRNTLGRWIH
jgi:hypothetical protein